MDRAAMLGQFVDVAASPSGGGQQVSRRRPLLLTFPHIPSFSPGFSQEICGKILQEKNPKTT